jgi:hypothetical protein
MEPVNYESVLDDLARAIDNKKCVLFLGPACSETLKLRQELGLESAQASLAPTQRTLICKLAEELDDEKLNEQFARICNECPDCSGCILPIVADQYQRLYGRDKLRDFAANLLKGSPRNFHRELWNLPFAAIYTVNYDELAIHSREGAVGGIVTEDKVFATVSLPVDDGRIPFYKLHGSLNADEVVITIDDHLKLKLGRQDSPLWDRLRWDLQTKTFLFIGYALGDMDVLEVIYSVKSKTGGHRPFPSYTVIETPLPWNAQRHLDEYGIRLVQKNADEFFIDLVKRYRELLERWSTISSSTPLKQRFPSIWKALEHILMDQSFSGLCLYGQNPGEGVVDRVRDELRVISTEMLEECKRRQAQGEKILCLHHDFSQTGTNTSTDPWRSVNLLQALVLQLDSERSAVGLPSMGLSDKLGQEKVSWETSANQKVHEYWAREFGKDGWEKVGEAVNNPTLDQQQVKRKLQERYLTGQVNDWYYELDPALDEYRLIVLFSDFHLIEPDSDWFRRVCQSFLSKLSEHNVGLIITRQVAKKLSVEQTFSAYSMDRFNQIDLGAFFRGGI